MDDLKPDGGTSREELLERVALMEAMIREGRRTTGRYGWIFVMWGLVYVTATLWSTFLPGGPWAWAVGVAIALVAHVVEGRRRSSAARHGSRSSNIESIWRALGISIGGFVAASIASHQAMSPAYVAAIFFFLGMAHGASGLILRWPVQIAVAVLWWACGVASFYLPEQQLVWLFLGASCFGMIFFGIYAMVKESGRTAGREERHA